jgi:hypothetical protein
MDEVVLQALVKARLDEVQAHYAEAVSSGTGGGRPMYCLEPSPTARAGVGAAEAGRPLWSCHGLWWEKD